MYRSQAPALQLRYQVRKKKPVIDTFQKWLDSFTAYILVIIAVYPAHALELIKHHQTISKAVTKFKGAYLR